jgi:hypothetical protein
VLDYSRTSEDMKNLDFTPKKADKKGGNKVLKTTPSNLSRKRKNEMKSSKSK